MLWSYWVRGPKPRGVHATSQTCSMSHVRQYSMPYDDVQIIQPRRGPAGGVEETEADGHCTAMIVNLHGCEVSLTRGGRL
jgi:hypothetical protein